MSFRVVIPRPGSAMRIAAGGAAAFADGSCVASRGGTVVHASAIWRRAPLATASGDDGTPLIIEYRHRASAGGVIPGTGVKRDPVRGGEAEILAARALDRAMRPRFKSETACYETVHVTATVHASDGVYDPVALASNACAAALELARVPWAGPPGTVRVGAGAVDGEVWHVDPTLQQLTEGGFDLLYAAAPTDEPSALMVELGCMPRYTNSQVSAAIAEAHGAACVVADAVSELARLCRDRYPMPGRDAPPEEAVLAEALALARAEARAFEDRYVHMYRGYSPGDLGTGDVSVVLGKSARGKLQHELNAAANEKCTTALSAFEDHLAVLAAKRGVDQVARSAFARAALEQRVDGRKPLELRPLQVETDVLPTVTGGNPHGSARFTRGETDVLANVVLDAPPQHRVFALDSDPMAAFHEHAAYRRTDALAKRKRGAVDLPPSTLAVLSPKLNRDPSEPNMPNLTKTSKPGVSGAAESPWAPLQPLDALGRRLIVHYEFPSHATATAAASMSANRRAVGHGALAERALAPLFPTRDAFPYTARVSCDVLASNGSSSMATVVAASLALFDAGVPLVEPVAGVSVGAVGSDSADLAGRGLMVDLNGTEDHFGDMDLKVGGTRTRITALQLDVKPKDGVPLSVLCRAFDAAEVARGTIFAKMVSEKAPPKKKAPRALTDDELVSEETGCLFEEITRAGEVRAPQAGLAQPRADLRPNAPRVQVVKFDPARLVDLLGRSGSTLKTIERAHRCTIDTSVDGEATVFAKFAPDCAAAVFEVQEIVADVEIGAELIGTVIEMREYGALVRVLRDREGLLHVSQLANADDRTESFLPGDSVVVRVIGVDPILGHVKLSRKGYPLHNGGKD
ncbi:ribosomal protein S5 domain 2-type protein [Pelagophyceae sp. CCMP2097]|nr:ribosomal protein S5 domain 2-type protein [Pelagophyceae sp. CCMP2097]